MLSTSDSCRNRCGAHVYAGVPKPAQNAMSRWRPIHLSGLLPVPVAKRCCPKLRGEGPIGSLALSRAASWRSSRLAFLPAQAGVGREIPQKCRRPSSSSYYSKGLPPGRPLSMSSRSKIVYKGAGHARNLRRRGTPVPGDEALVMARARCDCPSSSRSSPRQCSQGSGDCRSVYI